MGVPATATAVRRLRVSVRSAPRDLWALIGWAGLIVAGHLIGAALVAGDPRIHVSAPPLVGGFDVRLGPRALPVLVLAAGAVAWAPTVARRLPWRALLAVCLAAAIAWPVLLASTDGLSHLPAPLESRYEYLADVPRVGDPAVFLRHFVDDLPSYRTHVKGHPPGMLLLLAQMDRAGLGGGVAAAVLVIVVAALAPVGVLVAARELASEAHARRAAPYVVFAPAAVWIATSADALFAGVAATGIALFALATGRRGPAGHALALAAGVLLGVALQLSYGLAALGALVLLIAAHRRALATLLVAGTGVAAVVLAFGVAGFWWWDGLRATEELYSSGVAALRPRLPFVLIGLAAFALALGPAVVAGLAALRGRALWVLPAGALLAVAAASASGLSRGETERIWLPFVPWLALAAAALPRQRLWLALQVAIALAVQLGVRSPW
jgi:hypothetical protein